MNSSTKDLCVVYANCQADPLLEMLAHSPDFSALWDVHQYTNYIKEDIPQSDLDSCTLFLYQYLGTEWGDYSSASLLARLNPAAEVICLPNIFFKGYWPFWTTHSPIDFGDSLLDKLIDAGAQKPEILKIYYYGNIFKFVNAHDEVKNSLAIEAEKEKRSPIKIMPILQDKWKDEALFYTCNHPGKMLLLSVANQLLKLLGLSTIQEKKLTEYQAEYANFELPIHPQVASALGLSFIQPDHMFNVFGRKLSFLQYISRYIDCRQQGLDSDFIGYLQLI